VKPLELPPLLNGPWKHCLILTYGVNIPFYENSLWKQLGRHCHNNIILADGGQYLESSAVYAEKEPVRLLNQKYVVDGFYASTFHPKVILLTNEERGRLLIGSGNLSWQGYASGGEMFTQYQYNADTPKFLSAFVAFREFIEELIERKYFLPRSIYQIKTLFESTPWLFRNPLDDWNPVRHNLEISFLEQLQAEIANEPVNELWILAPFYDDRAFALERLLSTFLPKKTYVLLQPGYTSADPNALKRVSKKYGGMIEMRPFSMDDDPWVHNKLYLFKLTDRSIYFQGSPNLSQVAMLRTVPSGNVELATLSIGILDEFDYLLEPLNIQAKVKVENLADLQIEIDQSEIIEDEDHQVFQLTGGEWKDDWLRLFYRGKDNILEIANLKIENHLFPFHNLVVGDKQLKTKLTQDAVALLDHPVAVRLYWEDGGETKETNPVFVCNLYVLDSALALINVEGGEFEELGDLDLEDEELEQLLGDLENALVIDRRSIWHLAGKTPPKVSSDDEEELRLDYADIDYDMLRQHPKLRQYHQAGSSTTEVDSPIYTRTRLQIILSSITAHFQGLVDQQNKIREVDDVFSKSEDEEDSQDESLEEREEREKEREKRRLSWQRRIRTIFKRFFQRYMRGLRSPDFLELAGWDVVTKNYIIFSHILWRLFAKDWLEDEYIIDTYIQIWQFYWGSPDRPGYFRQLDDNIQDKILRFLRENKSDAQLLAALFNCNYLAKLERSNTRRSQLRDFWRAFLVEPPLDVNKQIIEDTWRYLSNIFSYEPPIPSRIFHELAELTNFETQASFLRSLEHKLGLDEGACKFEYPKPTVHRPYTRTKMQVDCLIIHSIKALNSKEASIQIYHEWMRYYPVPFCRIRSSDNSQLFVYDREAKSGFFAIRQGGRFIQEQPIEELPTPILPEWERKMTNLHNKAVTLDQELVFSPSFSLEHVKGES
jgi:hypothetical protein